MPAVVRIKRRIDEEPHTAFVLNGKRRRLHDADNALDVAGGAANAPAAATDKEELSTVLKFAGTLEKQDDCATKLFAAARLNKASAKELVQQRSSNTTTSSSARREKQRQEAQQAAREQRFRVVNCLRTTLDEQNDNSSIEPAAAAAGQITIVDIESQQTRAGVATTGGSEEPQPADSDIGYVYDLYVPENEQQAAYVDMMDDNYLSVRVMDELHFEDCFNVEDEDCDSEDSNQENYYTNDYPDEDDPAVLGSDDELCQHMHNFVLADDDDEYNDDYAVSSSEDEDYNAFHDPYVHTIDSESNNFVDDIDFCNVERQGSAYERYKRRVLRELEEDSDDAQFESASEQGDHSH